MSDLLTRWAVFEDCRRLALVDGQIEPFLARTMHEEREFARLGTLTRSGAVVVPHILAPAREVYRRGSPTALTLRQLAFALASVTS